MLNFQYSDSGFTLTKSFEGLMLHSYQDGAGVWTIGYGHTGQITSGMTITMDQAIILLHSDVQSAVTCVNRAVTNEALTQNQFDALVDFCFNAGRGNFLTSSLLKYVNKGDLPSAIQQFGLWVHAGGKVEQGLVRRRAAEAALFSS